MIDLYMNGGGSEVGAVRHHERHAMVTSYDAKRHLAKVMLQPEGQETGWLGIETGHVGNDYGIAIGLQGGDGKTTGDQVIVRFQEGDLESGKIVQRIHSEDEKPPTVQSGELVLWAKFKKHKGNKSNIGDETTADGAGGDDDEADSGQGGSGQQVYLKNDGSLTLTDGNGATIKCDGKGSVLIDCKTFTVVASNDVGIKGSNNVEIKAGSKLGLDGDSAVIVQGKGDVSDGSVSAPNDQPPIDPFKVPG